MDKTLDGSIKKKVEKFANKDDMLLCKEICHGIKHLKLDKPKTGIQPEFKGRKFELELGGEETIIVVKYNIVTSKGNKDAFILATDCMEKWEEFIKKEIK